VTDPQHRSDWARIVGDGPLPQGDAFGRPGIPPRWAHSNKDGIGTAYSADSPLWFTLWRGTVTELYFPTVDQPQVRDLQFLVSDGESFFHEEKRHLATRVERVRRHALLFRTVGRDPGGRYTIRKEVLSSPHLPALLERVRITVNPSWQSRLHLYVLCAPHLEGGGWGNAARRVEVSGRSILTATKGQTALALGTTLPFRRLSCGFVGRSDGWTDLADNFRMDWEFDSATEGNVALMGEIPIDADSEFTLALALGWGLPHAITTLFQALAIPYRSSRQRFIEQWERACRRLLPLEKVAHDGGRLLHSSISVLLAHEDKDYPGAFIASLSIPWGASRGDEERGGYHLVWTRDLVQVATGLLAAGNRETPLRALVYLATRQQSDGGFPQSFWISGEPYWSGVQLDEVSYPILLAWRLFREKALAEFDPYPMVLAAAGFLVRNGPATQQERWEEAGGYSPSTLAVNIAALVAASVFARQRGDEATAGFLEDYADFLERHIERWTVTTEGTLFPDIPRHFIRIHPSGIDDPHPAEDANHGELRLANQPPGASGVYPAKEIIDAGFLELVRYGIRAPDDPLIVASLRAVDRLLRAETPFGPCWRRYNHDGYGQRPDGGPFEGWGQGRAWPLLTGERAHYELAAGHDPSPFVEAMERFASEAGLLPEQVWDDSDRPDRHLWLGRPTGSAMPLAWAHSEYLSVLRSVRDGYPFARIPELVQRYSGPHRHRRRVEIWKPNHQAPGVAPGAILRVIAPEPFRLRWSSDGWRTVEETASMETTVRADFVDIAVRDDWEGPIRFTFYWPERERWEGRDFVVAVEHPSD
jgi:glucoamylase